MEERQLIERQQNLLRQKKKYTVLLSELGKSLQEYEVLERETSELDK